MHKKGHKLKTSPLIKNPQFSSNLADIQAKLPTHEVVILTKFHKDCKKIVDFLLTQKFLVCALFYASPFRCPNHINVTIKILLSGVSEFFLINGWQNISEKNVTGDA